MVKLSVPIFLSSLFFFGNSQATEYCEITSQPVSFDFTSSMIETTPRFNFSIGVECNLERDYLAINGEGLEVWFLNQQLPSGSAIVIIERSKPLVLGNAIHDGNRVTLNASSGLHLYDIPFTAFIVKDLNSLSNPEYFQSENHVLTVSIGIKRTAP